MTGTVKMLAASVLGFSALALAQDHPPAPQATNQPAAVSYQAILQSDKPIQGSILGESRENGTGVTFWLNLTDFPADAGPFGYHIHVNPVEGGNCTTTRGHLMPFDGPPDNFTCNPADSQFCQVGDLSGKHGKANPDESGKYEISYDDAYVNSIEGDLAYYGNRSIVIHASNGTRLNCASFNMVASGNHTNGNGTHGGHSQTASITATATSSHDKPSHTSSIAQTSGATASGTAPAAGQPSDFAENAAATMPSSVWMSTVGAIAMVFVAFA